MKNIKAFVLGLLLGGTLTAFGSAGARIIGSGTVEGVTVIDDSGDEMCGSVYYQSSTKELECEE
jgi:hypothetical protein